MKYTELFKKIGPKIRAFFSKACWRYLILFALGFGVGSFLSTHKIVVYKHDNPMEEMLEKMIKDKFGIVVDITPDSKEKYIKPKRIKKTRK